MITVLGGDGLASPAISFGSHALHVRSPKLPAVTRQVMCHAQRQWACVRQSEDRMRGIPSQRTIIKMRLPGLRQFLGGCQSFRSRWRSSPVQRHRKGHSPQGRAEHRERPRCLEIGSNPFAGLLDVGGLPLRLYLSRLCFCCGCLLILTGAVIQVGSWITAAADLLGNLLGR